MRLDQEMSGDEVPGVVIPINDNVPEDLADSA